MYHFDGFVDIDGGYEARLQCYAAPSAPICPTPAPAGKKLMCPCHFDHAATAHATRDHIIANHRKRWSGDAVEFAEVVMPNIIADLRSSQLASEAIRSTITNACDRGLIRPSACRLEGLAAPVDIDVVEKVLAAVESWNKSRGTIADLRAAMRVVNDAASKIQATLEFTKAAWRNALGGMGGECLGGGICELPLINGKCPVACNVASVLNDKHGE